MLSQVDNNSKLYCYAVDNFLVLVDYFNGWTYEYDISDLSITAYRDGEITGAKYGDGAGCNHLKDVFSRCCIVGLPDVVEWAYEYLDRMEEVVVELLGSQEEINRYFGVNNG